MELFTACPKGVEELLKAELEALGVEGVRATVAGAYFSGELEMAYRVCLWSRLANRVLLPLAKIKLEKSDNIYKKCQQVSWQQHLGPGTTFAIQFSGANDQIRNTQFGAQLVKDAIVDQLREAVGYRPDVDRKDPDLLINVRLAKDYLHISLDLSGGSLHRRGYRQANVPAPLKENLAAALLIRAGWPEIASKGGALIDPLCGGGTLLLEGAMMAADIAPGLGRKRFGFEHWTHHDARVWESLRKEAEARKAAGLRKGLPEIRGYDKDSRAVEAAGQNILCAGLSQWVRVSAKPLQAFKKPTHKEIAPGLVICNPPYGERWGDVEALRPLYETLGETLRRECPGWRLAVFTGNEALAGELKLRAFRKYKLFNGTIPCQLLLFELRESTSQSNELKERALSDGAQMFYNRLAKNAGRLASWRSRNHIGCYRLYDRDIPEYAVAIDIYGMPDQPLGVHIQEYAPPASVDQQSANRRLTDVRNALKKMFPECRDKLFFKQRKRQKGSDQYGRQSPGKSKKSYFDVREGEALLEVNLEDYLDTGLFLDHRPVRSMIHQQAAGKRFLNLFCYTATATVQAALGGATSSLSIDMSQTYLDWANRNFALNGIDSEAHKTLRADCTAWLGSAKGQFDLIFLDPPTFSNSSNMEGVLDIQRDHSDMIQKAMGLLSEQGVLLFSANFRKFKLDDKLDSLFKVECITENTIPPDFARNGKIHQCWKITHGR